MTRRAILTLTLAIAAFAASGDAAWPLAENGRARSVIVIADKPTRAAASGAAELAGTLKTMTGAEIPVVRLSKLKRDAGRTVVSVGDTPLAAKEGLVGAKLGMEGVRIVTRPGLLFLLGRDVGQGGMELSGTLWAVCVFEEQHLGCRWLWPGEDGAVIPRKPTLILTKPIDYAYTPPVVQRRIRNLAGRLMARLEPQLRRLGLTPRDGARFAKISQRWFMRQRIGKSVDLWYTHAYKDWYKTYADRHPDWFALQPTNTRKQMPVRERLCVSNPGLIEEVARRSIEHLKRNPQLTATSISPNDGGRNTFCMCEACRKLDPVDGPPIEFRYWKGPVRLTVPYVSLSDRYVYFYSEVAKRVAQALPNRYVGCYAYSLYRTPPMRRKLHDNCFIGFVGFRYMNDQFRADDRARWDAWKKSAKNLFLRPNALYVGAGGPVLFARRIAEDVKHCYKSGCRVYDFDGCAGHWGTQGLNYYVLAKVLWRPDVDVDAVIRDYLDKGFGPASKAMGAYFAAVQKWTRDLAATREYRGFKRDSRMLLQRFDDAYLASLRALLAKARSDAAGDKEVLARIETIARGVGYIEAQRDARLKKGRAKLDKFYKTHGLNWTVNSLATMYRLR